MANLFKILFKAPPEGENAQLLADSIPQGRPWNKKNDEDSNVRKLINSLAAAFNPLQQQIENMSIEFDIRQSVNLLSSWEKSVRLPDVCIGQLDDLVSRREEVVARMRKIPIVTLEELQYFVDRIFPGITVTLQPGSEVYNFDYFFPIHFGDDFNSEFVINVEVPIGTDVSRLNCVMSEVIPANVALTFDFI